MKRGDELYSIERLVDRGEADEAISRIHELQFHCGPSAELCWLLGRCYMAKGWHPEAVDVLMWDNELVARDDGVMKNQIRRLLLKAVQTRE